MKGTAFLVRMYRHEDSKLYFHTVRIVVATPSGLQEMYKSSVTLGGGSSFYDTIGSLLDVPGEVVKEAVISSKEAYYIDVTHVTHIDYLTN